MRTPATKAGRWLLDRSDWIDGLRAFRVRINATAGPQDMHRHILAIEDEATIPFRAVLAEIYTSARRLDGICRWCDAAPATDELDHDVACPAAKARRVLDMEP